MIVVHVITRFMRGGADENTLLSCNGQARNGHQVHLVYGEEFSPAMLEGLDSRIICHRIPQLKRPVRPVADAVALTSLVRLFRKIRPDIVHTHTSKAGILGRAAARICGVGGIVHGVHILPFVNIGGVERAVYLGLERLLAPTTHAFVNVSEGMRELGLKHRVGPVDRHCVVPSGMNVKAFRDARPFSTAERAQRLGLRSAEAPLLVLVAALEERKRQYEFLDVLRTVRTTRPDAELVLLGEGADEARIRARVAELGLDDAVHFMGFSSEVARWIASAAVCVFASEREGLPRAVIQYAMTGVPVVSTRLPGIEQVVIDGRTGRLVDVTDVSALAAPILDYLQQPDMAAQARGASRDIDFSPWEVESMVAQLEAVYLKVWRAPPRVTAAGQPA